LEQIKIYLVKETNKLLHDKNAYDSMSMAHNPYGDGKASQRIIDALLDFKSNLEKN
jgi:UDP-N-acetylglucosamine 2-epimerase (non-hydrolysing)